MKDLKMTSLTATLVAPTDAQLQTLRNRGWGHHIRYLRGIVEILGRHGEAYVFPLTAVGREQLQGFIEECVLHVSVEEREMWEHRAALAGVNDVDGMSTDALKAAVAGGAQ